MQQRTPIILSWGFGVESTAVLLRWLLEPETRYYSNETLEILKKSDRVYFELEDLTVIGSQTGDEHEDTQTLVQTYMFPLMRSHRIRFVEVARAGDLEEDGIVIIQDTREPYIFHREGAYKLSQHLKSVGTVPQYGGEHRCALKFKAFVIEYWLKYYFGRNDVCHVFGYNRDETERALRSTSGISKRNEQVLIAFGYNTEETSRADRNREAYQETNTREQQRAVRIALGYNRDEQGRADNSDIAYRKRNKTVRMAFGFNLDEQARANRAAGHDQRTRMAFGYNREELGRAERTSEHDTLERIGFYPLIDWGWTRQDCLDYIYEKLGVWWEKSACVFCPFNKEASKSTSKGINRLKAHPRQTADALLVEYISLCMNPRGALYNTRTLQTIVLNSSQLQALAEFERLLDESLWALYEVRRMYSKPGTAARSVVKLEVGSRAEMKEALDVYAQFLVEKTERGIRYVYFMERAETYPALEGFFVIAPNEVASKVRGKFEVFDERWNTLKLELESAPKPVAATVYQGSLSFEAEAELQSAA